MNRNFKFRAVLKEVSTDQEIEKVVEIDAKDLREATELFWDLCACAGFDVIKIIRVVITK